MGRLTFIAVLTLLYLQWGDSATIIRKDSGKNNEFLFDYGGVVKAKNSATETLLSIWSVNANLTLQSKGNDIVMKFNDIKNSLFTGDLEDAAAAKLLPIPEGAHHLSLPFIVHYYENGSASSLSHQPDDPLWSLNMKRAIASIIQLDTEHLNDLNGTNHVEESIYGNCEAEYLVFEDYNRGNEETTSFTVSKNWSDTSCADRLDNVWNNPSINLPIHTKVNREYRIQLANSDSTVEKISIESRATIIFNYNERSDQELEQRQYFFFKHKRDIVTPIDVSKITKSTSLVYVFDEDETSGRKPKKVVDQEKLIQDLRDSYTAFEADLQRTPLVPGDIGINDTLLDIANTLREMDKDSMDLTAFAALFTGDNEMKGLLVSMLPYIGTNEAVELIKLLVEKRDLDDLSLIKLMATFPRYVDEYSPELFKKMEVLLSLNAGSQYVKHTAILSFANLVDQAYAHIGKPEKYLQEYANQFLTLYKKASNDESKMMYLHGVINIGGLLDTNELISIIESKDESHYIRTLAAYGFKPYLISNKQEFQLFKRLWTIVSNADEHFDVRVAVLDLLMNSELTKTQFDTIIKYFEKSSNDPVQKHLQNYLSTTLESLQNTTKFNDYLGGLATELSINIPSYHETWTTGNYRIGYSDAKPTFGRYFHASLIANPVTNAINVIQLGSNQFGMTMSPSAYILYLRLDGVADNIFSFILKGKDPSTIEFPELVKILSKFNYKLIEDQKMHIEVVLFCDYRVVFGMQINQANVKTVMRNPMIREALELIRKYESVTYSKMYYGVMRSDLGTLVKTNLMETNFVSHELVTDLDEIRNKSIEVKTGKVKLRISNYEVINMVSYNPMVDLSISTYRYKSNAQRLDLPISANITGEYLIFENHDDVYNYVLSREIGITVDDAKKLNKYCSICEAAVKLPHQEPTMKLAKLEEIGLKLNVTSTKGLYTLNTFDPDFVEEYYSNSLAIPLAEPLLLMFYVADVYHYFGPTVNSESVRSKSYLSVPIQYRVEGAYNIDDIYEGKDPINGTQLSAGVKITSIIHPDSEDFASVRTRYSYSSAPVLNPKDGSSHMTQKHKFRLDYTDSHNINLICFDRELQYPRRRPDKLSISPVEPAIGKGRISTGKSDKSYTCSNDFSITFSEIYEPADNQMETVQNMKEYKICKQEAAGLKYIPPTEACLDVHDAVSKYNKYMLFVDLKNAGEWSQMDKDLRTSDRGIKALEYNYIDDDLAHVELSGKFWNLFPIDLDKIMDFNISLGVFSGSENPTSVAYGDDDVIFGISSLCDITPSQINTFTGKHIENYQAEDGKEIVAYIECFNRTRNGLTIQKFSDKKIGFTMWSGSDKLIVSLAEGKMKVNLNGEELHKQHSASMIKVYFLADDVIYIANDDFEVYYNTEYISIKTLFLYNNYICGLCAHDRKT
ncbi:crossveinless d [Carabus blaptoides fortunei]